MKFKESSIIKLFVGTSLAIALSFGVYWTLNKEQITLIVKGEERTVSTFKKTVKELLSENEVKYDDNDIITPSLDSEVNDYMEIKVVDVTESKISEKVDIPFEVKSVDDENLLKGKTEVSQEGEAGEKEITYTLTYHDGKLIKKVLEGESISKEPVDKIVKNGTKEEVKEEVIVASRGTTSRNISTTSQESSTTGTHMSVVATAYAGDSITSTGTTPKWGTIAVDPRVIPYGTKVYIPQFGRTFIANNTGGAIKGNKIDIFMNTKKECYNWGRRTIEIQILG